MVDSTTTGALEDTITIWVVVLTLSTAVDTLTGLLVSTTIGAEVARVVGMEVGAQLYTVTVETWATDDGVEEDEAAAQPLAVSVISTHFNWPVTGVVYTFHSVSDAGQA